MNVQDVSERANRVDTVMFTDATEALACAIHLHFAALDLTVFSDALLSVITCPWSDVCSLLKGLHRTTGERYRRHHPRLAELARKGMRKRHISLPENDVR
jgi:hypothetical protein